MPRRYERPLAALLALLGWSALALQLYLTLTLTIANGGNAIAGVVRYFSFFTVLTNTLVAMVLSAPFLPEPMRRWWSQPSVRGATAAYIAMVGIIYSLILRETWSPEGLQKIADVVLHDVMPVLYVVFWLAHWRTGTLRWTDVPSWLIYPLAYLAFSLVRGPYIAWYPYPFLDVGLHGYAMVMVSASVITMAFVLLSLLIVGVDRAYRLTLRMPPSA